MKEKHPLRGTDIELLFAEPFVLPLWTYVRSCSKYVHVVHADPVFIGVLDTLIAAKAMKNLYLENGLAGVWVSAFHALSAAKPRSEPLDPPGKRPSWEHP